MVNSMELTDLDICKRIAEIEHGRAFIDCDEGGRFVNLYDPRSDRGGEEYNPLTDKALNCELRDKYNVEVNYGYKTCSIYAYSYFDDGSLSSCASIVSVDFKSKEEIPRAVLLCIIEAKADD